MLEITDLAPRIGSRVVAEPSQLLSGAHSRQIRALLEQRGVLLFPQLGFTDEEQLTFAETLGEVIQQGIKGIYKITLDPTLNDTADYLHATTHWHVDGAQDTVPTLDSLLTARVLSEVGGADRVRQHLRRLRRSARREEAPGGRPARDPLAGIYPTRHAC